jgi:integrase
VFIEAEANSTANLADYWLPLLALFTGARKGELAKLRAKDVAKDDATGCYMLSITEDKQEGKSLKTASSWRTVPVHPELTRLGFLDLVEAAKVRGDADWLLPTVSTARALGTWGERFGRTLEKLGIGDRKGMHSFRHCFKDALRAAGVSEDLSDALTGHSGGWGGAKVRGAAGACQAPSQANRSPVWHTAHGLGGRGGKIFRH